MLRLNRYSGGLAAAALALGACGSKPASISPGTYVVTLAGTHSELDGEWALTLAAGGRFSIALNGQVAVDGIYDLDGSQVYFTDQGGPMKCATDIARGRYAWELAEGKLKLTVVTDNCLGRRGILATQPLALRAGSPQS